MSVLLHGYVTVPTGGWDLTVQLSGGSPVRSVTIPAGEYRYGLLVAEVRAQVQASGAEHATFAIAIASGDMVAAQGAGPGNTMITWTDTILRDHLGYTGATTTLTGTTVLYATLPPSAYLPLAYEAIDDRPAPEELRTAVYSDTRQYTVAFGRREWRTVRLRFTGAPRASAVDEYLRFRRWFEYVVATGAKFRYYPRASVTTAYAAITNPYGYTEHTWAEPTSFAPDQITPGWYSQWAITCRFFPA